MKNDVEEGRVNYSDGDLTKANEWNTQKNVYFTNYDYVMGFGAFSIPTIHGHSTMHRVPHTDDWCSPPMRFERLEK